LSPHPLHYLLAYGVMLVLGVLLFKRESFTLLWIWIACAALLLYAPLAAQRRFVEGLQVPLAVLATAGLFSVVFPRLERTRVFRALAARPGYSAQGLRQLLVILFLLVMSLANWVILLRLSFVAAVEQLDPLFRNAGEMRALDWLREHTRTSDIVLATYPTASLIPARAGNVVFVGQRYESAHFESKLKAVARFFDASTDDAWRKDLLARYRVAYVFVGHRERELGKFDPARASYLQSVYSNSGFEIYAVQR
jgi:uncharacterized membrane protein